MAIEDDELPPDFLASAHRRQKLMASGGTAVSDNFEALLPGAVTRISRKRPADMSGLCYSEPLLPTILQDDDDVFELFVSRMM